jgi:hypothetical protein
MGKTPGEIQGAAEHPGQLQQTETDFQAVKLQQPMSIFWGGKHNWD